MLALVVAISYVLLFSLATAWVKSPHFSAWVDNHIQEKARDRNDQPAQAEQSGPD